MMPVQHEGVDLRLSRKKLKEKEQLIKDDSVNDHYERVIIFTKSFENMCKILGFVLLNDFIKLKHCKIFSSLIWAKNILKTLFKFNWRGELLYCNFRFSLVSIAPYIYQIISAVNICWDTTTYKVFWVEHLKLFNVVNKSLQTQRWTLVNINVYMLSFGLW